MSRKTPPRYNRRVSDDIASLDSWSEALNEDASPSGSRRSSDNRYSRPDVGADLKERKNSSNQLLLNPSKLYTPGLPITSPFQIHDTPRTGVRVDENVSTEFNIGQRTVDPFEEEDDFPYNNHSAYSSLPESYSYSLAPSINHSVNSDSDLDYSENQINEFHSLPDLSSTKPRTYSPHYIHSKTEQTDHGETSEKVKNKIMSVWNNVKYGWTLKTKTTFRFDSPVWLLGKCYHIKPSDEDVQPGRKTRIVPNIEKFKQDFSSLLWFTYRQDFLQIPGTKLTSDCGWGCMLRSGQMMLARAFTSHYLGRNWNVFSDQTREQETYRKQIIRWFGDYLCDESPFSMHRLVEVGKTLGKQPGEWYGPASVAYILRQAMLMAYSTQTVLTDICVYVSQDCTIYKQDIYEMCCTRSRAITKYTSSTESDTEECSASALEWKRALVILIPVRLGGEQLNSVYTPCIKSLLAQDSCIGIIGGKPKHSLYFVGWQDEKLIYLDPHYCQDVVDTRERNFPIQSYHCLSPRKVSIDKIDPSCTIGFYCRSQKEFEKFVKQAEEMVSPPLQRLSYPMFVFNDGHGSDVKFDSVSAEEDQLLRVKHVKLGEDGRIRSATIESEEFVVL